MFTHELHLKLPLSQKILTCWSITSIYFWKNFTKKIIKFYELMLHSVISFDALQINICTKWALTLHICLIWKWRCNICYCVSIETTKKIYRTCTCKERGYYGKAIGKGTWSKLSRWKIRRYIVIFLFQL